MYLYDKTFRYLQLLHINLSSLIIFIHKMERIPKAVEREEKLSSQKIATKAERKF